MQDRRPLIGVMASHDGEQLRTSMRYLNALWRAGGVGIMLAYTNDQEKLEEYAALCDGFLFSGGVDLDPALYGEAKQFDSVEIDRDRDAFEQGVFRAVYPTGKPILGICRGIQALNVFLGGTLYQHIDGHQQSGVPYEAREYPLKVLPDGLLYRLCGKTEIFVNSYHHQNVKQLAPSLRADGVSRDGYIEALHSVEHPFLLAVQFHPEIYNGLPDDDHSAAIFGAFIEACR